MKSEYDSVQKGKEYCGDVQSPMFDLFNFAGSVLSAILITNEV